MEGNDRLLTGRSANLVDESLRTGKALINKQAVKTFTRIMIEYLGYSQEEAVACFSDKTKFIWTDE